MPLPPELAAEVQSEGNLPPELMAEVQSAHAAGRPNLCKALLELGADRTLADADGHDSLALALQSGDWRCIKLFIKRDDISEADAIAVVRWIFSEQAKMPEKEEEEFVRLLVGGAGVSVLELPDPEEHGRSAMLPPTPEQENEVLAGVPESMKKPYRFELFQTRDEHELQIQSSFLLLHPKLSGGVLHSPLPLSPKRLVYLRCLQRVLT